MSAQLAGGQNDQRPLWRRGLTHCRQTWHRYRNMLLQRQRFHHRIGRTPLLRRIAQQRATQLHHVTAGFVYSQVLFACVELELFEQLRNGPKRISEIARGELTEQGLERLLLAAAAIELLESYDDQSWGLSELSAAMLANPGIGAMVRHHRHLYADLADPLALLQRRGPTHLSAYWPYARGSTQGDAKNYTALMAESQDMIAGYILDAKPLDGALHLVDVAGGAGRFARHALGRYPSLRATVIDLAPVIADSDETGDPDSELQRLSFLAGDMFHSGLPTDASVISFIRVLHDHDDAPAQRLIQRAFDALPAGGRLLIAEPLAGTHGAEAIGDAYFGIYLWAMGSGRPRRADEYRQMCAAAGFGLLVELPSAMPCLVRVLCAEKTVILS